MAADLCHVRLTVNWMQMKEQSVRMPAKMSCSLLLSHVILYARLGKRTSALEVITQC